MLPASFYNVAMRMLDVSLVDSKYDYDENNKAAAFAFNFILLYADGICSSIKMTCRYDGTSVSSVNYHQIVLYKSPSYERLGPYFRLFVDSRYPF